jgi:hypothetical protein
VHRLATSLRVSRVLLVVLSLGIGFAAGSAFIAYGATNDTFNACITPKGDIYRVRKNASWSCLTGDTKISWNQQGAQGVQGPLGPAGAAAQTNITIRSREFTILQNSVFTETMLCEAGEEVIGGGFKKTTNPGQAVISASLPKYDDPSGNEGWSIIYDTVGALFDPAETATIYATCLAP